MLLILVNLIFLFLMTFIQRYLISRYSKIDFDTYGHLNFVKGVKNSSSKPWEPIKIQSWRPEPFYHPFFWHKILAAFDIDFLLLKAKLINPAIEAIFAVIFFCFGLLIFEDILMANIAAFLYVWLPVFFSSFSIGTRVNSLTPRLTSEILFNILVVAIILNNGSYDIWLFLLIVLLNSSIILTSKFGLQAQLFILPLYSIISLDLTPIISLFFSILLVLIISKFQASHFLLRQFTHLKEYVKNNKERKNLVHNRNSLSSFVPKTPINAQEFKRLIWQLLATNSYTGTIFKFPVIFIVFALYLSGHPHDNEMFEAALYMSAASFIVFIMINLPALLFLGEAERYLSHSAVSTIITFTFLIIELQLEWMILLFLLYGVVYFLCEIIVLKHHKIEQGDDDDIIESYLMAKPGSQVVGSFPYHNFDVYRLMLKTQHRGIMPVFFERDAREAFIEKYEYKYPYFDLNKLNEISQLTSMSVCIIQISSLLSENFHKWKPPDGWTEISLPQEKYLVLERKFS